MDVIYNACCVLDVYKNKIVACLKVKCKKDVIREFSGHKRNGKLAKQ